MDLTKNIIEITDEKYILNVEILRSIISLAQGCDSIALISIIGPKQIGKSFLMNCLLNYLESQDRNSWPKASVLKYNHGFRNDPESENPVIQLWSKPLILEDEDHKTAIFLMDSSYIFNTFSEKATPKFVEDMLGLFMFTSSTIIYIEDNFHSDDMIRLRDCAEKNRSLMQSNDLFGELFLYVRDWNLKFKNQDLLFGSKGGKQYINNQFEELELNNYWDNIECYLMPPPGSNIYKQHNEDIQFSELDNQYITQLSQMIQTRLLNIDEMKIKTRSKTDEAMSSNELTESFEFYINKLNEEKDIEHIDKKFGNISISSSVKPTIIKSFKGKTEGIKLDERHSNLIETVDREPKFGNQVLKTAEDCKNVKIFGDNKPQRLSLTTFSFGVNPDNLVSSIPQQSIRTDSSQIEEMEVSHDAKDPQNIILLSNSNKTQKSTGIIDVNTDITEPMDTTDHQVADSVIDDFCETDCHQNEEEMKDVSNSRTSSPSDLETKDITQELHERCQKFFNEYRISVEKAIKDENFNIKNGFPDVHNNAKSKTMSAFDNHFKNYKYQKMFKDYRKQLSTEIDTARDSFKPEIDELFERINNQYELIMNESTKFYDIKMNDLIERHCNLDKDFELTKLHNQSRQFSIQSFESNVKNTKTYNTNLMTDFSKKLKEALNKRRKRFETAFDQIKSYRTEWDKKYNNYRYIPRSHMQEIHDDLSQNVGFQLEKLEVQKLKNIILKILNNIFIKIQERNEEINNHEKAISEEVINFVFNLFCESFENKLKSDLYNQIDVEKIYQKLMDYTLNAMVADCDFREYQKDLSLKSQNDFKEKANKFYTKISSNYFKKVVDAKRVISNAKDEALEKYLTEMKRSLAEKTYHNSNEFERMNSQSSDEALKVNEKMIQCLKNDFNSDFYDFLLSENITQINKEIMNNKHKFEAENDRNAPKLCSIAIYFGRYDLIAAHYEKEIKYILDKNGLKLRSNSIAVSDEILFGNEAKTFNENRQSDKEDSIDENFDIKQLVTKSIKNMSESELSSYPFEFTTDKLRVKVENRIKHDFSIESLLALQVLDIKLDAEKELGENISNAVFTVPTYYNLRQKNAFRDVAKIAGLQKVTILSEISAAAISYATDLKRVNKNNSSTVFFVVINEYECDAAVCHFKDMNIDYKSYFHKNLFSYVGKSSIFDKIGRCFSFFNRSNGVEEKLKNDHLLKEVEKLFNNTLSAANIDLKNSKQKIDNIIVAGSSILMDLIRQFTADYFGPIQLYSCDLIDIIVGGSAIFSQSMANNKSNVLCIKEVSLNEISFAIEEKQIPKKKPQVLIKNNNPLPFCYVESFKLPREYNLPLRILIYQDNSHVSSYNITNLPKSISHKIQFKLDQFGNISLLLKNTNTNDLKLNETRLDLKENEIIEERNIIASIEKNIKDKQKLNEKNSATKQAKDQLQEYYFEVMKSVDSKSAFRGLKKKKLMAELEKTLTIIESSDDSKTIADQKLRLEETVKCLLN